jgi:energy-coupling factor transporter ATP-binding protein EcfA2
MCRAVVREAFRHIDAFMSTTTLDDAAKIGASDSQWAVETHGLTKRFGDNIAVNGVELLVPRGCAFGYLGPNGAGKTTLIRVLLGLTHADAGTMSLLGYSVPKHRDRALARVGAIVDEPRFHGHLTGRQNLADPGGRSRARAKGASRVRSGPRRHAQPSRRQGHEVLHGHAPATRCRGLSPRRPPALDPRRTNERSRPRGHARDARHDPLARRRGPDRRAVVAPPRRGGTHL